MEQAQQGKGIHGAAAAGGDADTVRTGQYLLRDAEAGLADERDEDPILDANAAMLYHGYFRLLRLAKNLESASMLNRRGCCPPKTRT